MIGGALLSVQDPGNSFGPCRRCRCCCRCRLLLFLLLLLLTLHADVPALCWAGGFPIELLVVEVRNMQTGNAKRSQRLADDGRG